MNCWAWATGADTAAAETSAAKNNFDLIAISPVYHRKRGRLGDSGQPVQMDDKHDWNHLGSWLTLLKCHVQTFRDIRAKTGTDGDAAADLERVGIAGP